VVSAAAATVGENRAGSTVDQPSRRAGRKAARGRTAGPARPAELRGAVSTGRIVKLLIGQSHGFIRLANGREVYFHRSDLEDGISFNDFAIGDAVSFELLEDAFSGARALRVKPHPRPR
jgi:cold shock CspA family protein